MERSGRDAGSVAAHDFQPGTAAPDDSRQAATEESPGIYRIGPLAFGGAGRWIIRFHLYDECDDTAPDSPHAHAAFFVDVP
jgi:hypothetical protein